MLDKYVDQVEKATGAQEGVERLSAQAAGRLSDFIRFITPEQARAAIATWVRTRRPADHPESPRATELVRTTWSPTDSCCQIGETGRSRSRHQVRLKGGPAWKATNTQGGDS